jgi:hypothetical protein
MRSKYVDVAASLSKDGPSSEEDSDADCSASERIRGSNGRQERQDDSDESESNSDSDNQYERDSSDAEALDGDENFSHDRLFNQQWRKDDRHVLERLASKRRLHALAQHGHQDNATPGMSDNRVPVVAMLLVWIQCDVCLNDFLLRVAMSIALSTATVDPPQSCLYVLNVIFV